MGLAISDDAKKDKESAWPKHNGSKPFGKDKTHPDPTTSAVLLSHSAPSDLYTF